MSLIHTLEELSGAYLHHVLRGDRKGASKLVHQFLESDGSVKELYEQVIKPALYRVGELWENNQITVAEEHTATSITEAVMNEIFGRIISTDRRPYSVVLSSVENEYHLVGIKMVADVFEMNGWDTFLPGANVPVNELVRYIDRIHPDLLALSASIYFHLPTLRKMLHQIRYYYPELPVIAGGQAFLHGGREISREFTHLNLVDNLNDLEKYIIQFEQHGFEQHG